MGLFSFRKEERLCKKKHIRELFKKGSSFYSFPFKVFLLPQADAALPHQVLISVPGRNFKKAADRNLIKRRVREAYRLQKHKLPQSTSLAMGLIYSAREIMPFEEIQRKMILSFGKIDKMVSSLNAGNKPATPE